MIYDYSDAEIVNSLKLSIKEFYDILIKWSETKECHLTKNYSKNKYNFYVAYIRKQKLEKLLK